jgi:hypothetical protein
LRLDFSEKWFPFYRISPLVLLHEAAAIDATFQIVEKFRNLRVAQRLPGCVRDEVLLRNIGYVFSFLVFGEQVVERLILAGPDFLGNGLVPLLGIVKFGIDVEDHPAKWKEAVPYHLSKLIFRCLQTGHLLPIYSKLRPIPEPVISINAMRT